MTIMSLEEEYEEFNETNCWGQVYQVLQVVLLYMLPVNSHRNCYNLMRGVHENTHTTFCKDYDGIVTA